MKLSEISDLLTLAAVFDRRLVGDADVEAWALVLVGIEYGDAQAAVLRHYETETQWIMPADVRRLVRAARDAEARDIVGAGQPELVPAADPDDIPAYLRALREQRHLAASGVSLRAVLRLEVEVEAGARAIDIRRTTAQQPSIRAYSVDCPHCPAEAGDHCVTRIEGHRLTDPHGSRVDAARAAAAQARDDDQ